jgi:signal transduction histidine kinase
VLAARLLLDLIADRPVPEHNVSPAPLIIRQSCGCTNFTPETAAPVISHRSNWVETLRAHSPVIVQVTTDSLPQILRERVSAWVNDWISAYGAALNADDQRIFLRALEGSQRDGFELGIELAAWHRTVAAFFSAAHPCLNDAVRAACAAYLETEAHLRLGMIAEQLENARQIELERRDVALRDLSETLLTTFDLHSLFEVLDAELHRVNVRACYIALFEDPQRPADLARLLFGWRNGERVALPPEGIIFPSTQLMPTELNAALASPGLVVEALYSKEDRLGFMLLEVEPRFAAVTNSMRALLSGALQGVLLLEQRRKAEAKLIASQHELENSVTKLEYINRELESFAYSISHDLRAPLRAISGYATIIANDHRAELTDEAQQLFGHIASNAKRMGMLIDDLLAFSRAGRHELRRKVVDMNAIVRDLLTELANTGGNNIITWDIGALPQVEADAALIRQVWFNLIHNAVKYSAKVGAPRVTISAEEKTNEVIFSVRDNGTGFDMRYADKLFGVFQRLHRDEDYAGTGIGLAIVKRIVERHGGRVWAESEVGKGAVFYFSLPTPK